MSAVPQNPDLEAQEWLHNLDDKLLACRLGHRWPRWKAGNLGRGWRFDGPYRNGVFEIYQVCLENCGKERRMVTAPNGGLAVDSKWQHNNPVEYRAPKGTRIRPRDCLGEALRRSNEVIRATARKPDAPTTRKPAAVKAAK